MEDVPAGPESSPPPGPVYWPWAALLAGGVAIAAIGLLWTPAPEEPPLSFPLRNIHWHAEVKVVVSGRPVDLGPVPAGRPFVGVAWLHHHGDNIAHIESFNHPDGEFRRPGQISLGAFFDAIGVRLAPEQVCFPDSTGCANGKRFRVEAFVNGHPKADFLNHTLRDGDAILVRAE